MQQQRDHPSSVITPTGLHALETILEAGARDGKAVKKSKPKSASPEARHPRAIERRTDQ
jgi:hypothetical protein